VFSIRGMALFAALGGVTAGATVGAAPASAVVVTPQALVYATPATYTYFPPRRSPVVADGFAGRPGHTQIAPRGTEPVVSPRGDTVAYLVDHGPDTTPTLWLATARGTKIVRRAIARTDDIQGFSPDGTRLAFVDRGRSERTNFRLRVHTPATGRTRTVVADPDFFLGTSFSPDGRRIAYVTERSTGYDEDSRGALQVVPVTGGPPVRLTDERTAKAPLWGPAGIAYLHPRLNQEDKEGVLSTLDLIQGDGTGHRAIAAFPGTSALSDGFYPVAWSADGTRLLANAAANDERNGDDSWDGWAIDVATGAARDLTGKVDGVVARAFSRDGLTVLAETGHGTFGLKHRHDVVTVPFAGGPLTMLVKNGGSPSWTR